MALNAQNKKGLSGYTLSSDYALAMLDWRDEKKRRQDALDDLSPLPDETSQEFVNRRNAMPHPRGWTEYALDPRNDGAPVEDGSNAPMGLARNDQLNTDSLVLKDWWQDAGTPGQEAEDILLYKGEIKARTGGPTNVEYYTDYLLDEAITPDTYIRTGMADYVPNMFNLFVDENGYRIDPAYIKGTGFWPTTKRAGLNLVQGGVGFAMLGVLGLFVGRRILKGAEEGSKGSINIVGGILTEIIDEAADITIATKDAAKRIFRKGSPSGAVE